MPVQTTASRCVAFSFAAGGRVHVPTEHDGVIIAPQNKQHIISTMCHYHELLHSFKMPEQLGS